MSKSAWSSRKRLAASLLAAGATLCVTAGAAAAPVVRCVSTEEDRLMLREYRLLPERARNSAIVICLERYSLLSD